MCKCNSKCCCCCDNDKDENDEDVGWVGVTLMSTAIGAAYGGPIGALAGLAFGGYFKSKKEEMEREK